MLLSLELAAVLLACELFCIFPTADKSERSATSVILAVEVEPLGCSFNPPFEAHQDSLALAVADEMCKIYTKELGPKLVPLTVPGEAIAEEDKFFLDADDGDEDAAEGDGDQDTDALVGQRRREGGGGFMYRLNCCFLMPHAYTVASSLHQL